MAAFLQCIRWGIWSALSDKWQPGRRPVITNVVQEVEKTSSNRASSGWSRRRFWNRPTMCVATIDVEREECREKEQLSLCGAPDPRCWWKKKNKKNKKQQQQISNNNNSRVNYSTTKGFQFLWFLGFVLIARRVEQNIFYLRTEILRSLFISAAIFEAGFLFKCVK